MGIPLRDLQGPARDHAVAILARQEARHVEASRAPGLFDPPEPPPPKRRPKAGPAKPSRAKRALAEPDPPTRITFEIPGEPVPEGRARAHVVAGFVKFHPDPKTERYQKAIRQIAAAHRPPRPLLGPLYVEIVALFDRPQELRDRSKRTGELLHASEGRMPHASKPDADNVEKAVLDGITGSGIWEDDAQVCDVRTSKRWAAFNEAPHVEVTISTY